MIKRSNALLTKVALTIGLLCLTSVFTTLLPAGLAVGGPGRRATCANLVEDLNTGRDQYAGNVLTAAGQPDDDWQVTLQLTSGVTGFQAATVVNAPRAWPQARPGSGWITAVANGTDPGTPLQAGTYTFQRSFCLNQEFANAKISLDLYAESVASVSLNGTLIGGPGGAVGDAAPLHVEKVDQTLFKVGRNTVTIVISQPAGRVIGLDVAGSVTADNGFCCVGSPGTIRGAKWNDQNGNGVRDAQESGLSGWLIQARGADGMLSGSATTDAQGEYSLSLAPGLYSISETAQTGWTQIFPAAPGIHAVPLPAGELIAYRNFGNRVAAALPDLVAAPPPEVEPVPLVPFHFMVRFRIVNQGAGPVTVPANHQIWLVKLGEDSEGEMLKTVTTDAPLAAGGYQEFTYTFEIPEDGAEADYFVRIIVDSDKKIAESDERNNIGESQAFRP